jgi:hypothetical protein
VLVALVALMPKRDVLPKAPKRNQMKQRDPLVFMKKRAPEDDFGAGLCKEDEEERELT